MRFRRKRNKLKYEYVDKAVQFAGFFILGAFLQELMKDVKIRPTKEQLQEQMKEIIEE